MMHRSPQSGYSLIELSIVLVIISALLAAGVTLGTAKSLRTEILQTHNEMSEVDKALHSFLNEFGRLPCPADITLARSDALYGREATDCSDATPPAGITRVEYPASSGQYMRIGGLPFFSLHLPESYLADDWHNRYVYAVNESAITSLSEGDEGTITILDDGEANIIDNAVWVLVSNGPSHKGATSDISATVNVACDAGDLDGENCDGDGVFIDAAYNDGDTATSFSDDLIIWKTRMRAFAALAAASDGYKPWMKGQTGSTAAYPLEVKGVTSVTFDGMQGYSTYSNQCNVDYPGSWFMRTSDLEYVEDLPLIAGSRIHMDSCDHDEQGDKKCYLTFSKTAHADMKTFAAGSDEWASLGKHNCGEWTTNDPSLYALSIGRDDASLNFRHVRAAPTLGLYLEAKNCSKLLPFLCVGEK